MSVILPVILSHPFYFGISVFVVLLAASHFFSDKKVRPPGPPGHPLIGHTLKVPTTTPWKYFEELGNKYGPIVRLSLAGDNVVILNDPKDAEEILGKRSANYSSRRPLVYAGKHQSNNNRLLLLPYGNKLKAQRAAFHQMLQSRVVGSYETMQEREAARMLRDMVRKPAEANLNAKRFAAALNFVLTYGKKLKDDDEDLLAVLSVLDGFIADCYPGAHIVDTFPILDKLPSFLAPWKSEARRKHEHEMKLYGRLVNEVKEKSLSGSTEFECFAARLWEQQSKTNFTQEDIAYVAGTAFEAGTGTISSTILWFMMAAILYPHVVCRAQQELDEAVGADGKTMPGYVHMKQLPYCIALVKECFRWMPAAPGGFPHYSDHDDEYKGYFIDAKTIVIPNTWAMQHNPEAFPNPRNFDPTRFLRPNEDQETEPDALTEGHWAFGFGRRICPGRYLGSKSTWLAITRLVWGFNIEPELDAQGNPLPVYPDNCTSGITSEPFDFPCKITPRSPQHAATIESTWEAASKTYDV